MIIVCVCFSACITIIMLCRLSYVAWILGELIPKIQCGADVYIMYDIACTLVQHLKGREQHIC